MTVSLDTSVTIDYESQAFLTNPWPVYAQLREEDPVHWAPKVGAWYVLRHADVRKTLVDPSFTVAHPFRASRQVMGPTLLDLDGEVHQRLKKLVRPDFIPARSEEYGVAVVAPMAAQLVEEAVSAGKIDLVSAIALELPIRVLLQLMGLPAEHASWYLRELRPVIRYLDDAPRASLEEGSLARERLDGHLSGLLEGEGSVSDGVMGRLVGFAEDGDSIRHGEVERMALLLLAAGTETTSAAISNLFHALLLRPDWFERLGERPELVPLVVRRPCAWSHRFTRPCGSRSRTPR